MNADDPGSLSRLHDIILAPPVSWWPPAPAWYVVMLLLVIASGSLCWWAVVRWRRNWYRRAGLAELAQLQTAPSATSLADVAELVKRVAIAGYPRERVASLSGAEWLSFLDETSNSNQFTTGPGRGLSRVYELHPPAPTPELLHVVRSWIKNHASAKRREI